MLPLPADEFERLHSMLTEQVPQIPSDEVRHEMVRGFRDLDGQIRPQSLAEMLYALVRYRLGQRIDDRRPLYRTAS